MIPKCHIVHYKNHTIHYMNGVYKIAELPIFPFLTINEAFKEIDKVVDPIEKLFDNVKKLNEIKNQKKKTIL